MNIAQFRKLVDQHVSRIAGVALDDLPDVALDDYLDADDSIEDGVAAETALEVAIEILDDPGVHNVVLQRTRPSPAVIEPASVEPDLDDLRRSRRRSPTRRSGSRGGPPVIVREYLDQEDDVRRPPDLAWSRHRLNIPTAPSGTVAVVYVEARTPAGRDWYSRTKHRDVPSLPDGFLIHPDVLPILLCARDEGLVVEEVERTVVDDREDRS